MTTDQAADILDVTVSQIYKLIGVRILRAKWSPSPSRKRRYQWAVNGQDVQRQRRLRNAESRR